MQHDSTADMMYNCTVTDTTVFTQLVTFTFNYHRTQHACCRFLGSAQPLPPTVSASLPPQSGASGILAFVLVCHHRHSTIFLNPLLQAGLQWLTQVPLVDTVHFNGFLLTYLLTRPIISLSHRAISAGIITKGKSFYICEVLTLRHILACSLMVSCGTLVAPICCVIPPASPS